MKKNLFKRSVASTLAATLAITAIPTGTGLMLTGCKKKEVLNVLGYGEYVHESVFEKFEEEYGVKVKYDEAESSEEIYTKFVSGTVDYDLVCASDYMILKMKNEGLLGKVDYSKLPNASKNIGEDYWSFTQNFDADNEYALPYFWGTLGIVYNSEMVPEGIDSWGALFDGKYKESITMPDSMRDAFMTAYKYLGYSINTTDKDEIKKAQELLVKQFPDVYSYALDSARLDVVNEDVALAVVYSGDGYKACCEGSSAGSKIEYVVPKEGSNVFIDCFAMAAKPQNEEAAKNFLDFLCREDIGRINFDYSYYATPNTAVYENLPEDVKNNPYLFPDIKELESRLEVLTMVDQDTLDYMTGLWNELMADLE